VGLFAMMGSNAGDPIPLCREHVRERTGQAPWRPRRSLAPSWRETSRRRDTPDSDPVADRHAEHMKFARSIWDAAKPARGTLVERYLVETRRLELRDTDEIGFTRACG
jgi:hypothetical protein